MAPGSVLKVCSSVTRATSQYDSNASEGGFCRKTHDGAAMLILKKLARPGRQAGRHSPLYSGATHLIDTLNLEMLDSVHTGRVETKYRYTHQGTNFISFCDVQ